MMQHDIKVCQTGINGKVITQNGTNHPAPHALCTFMQCHAHDTNATDRIGCVTPARKHKHTHTHIHTKAVLHCKHAGESARERHLKRILCITKMNATAILKFTIDMFLGCPGTRMTRDVPVPEMFSSPGGQNRTRPWCKTTFSAFSAFTAFTVFNSDRQATAIWKMTRLKVCDLASYGCGKFICTRALSFE